MPRSHSHSPLPSDVGHLISTPAVSAIRTSHTLEIWHRPRFVCIRSTFLWLQTLSLAGQTILDAGCGCPNHTSKHSVIHPVVAEKRNVLCSTSFRRRSCCVFCSRGKRIICRGSKTLGVQCCMAVSIPLARLAPEPACIDGTLCASAVRIVTRPLLAGQTIQEAG